VENETTPEVTGQGSSTPGTPEAEPQAPDLSTVFVQVGDGPDGRMSVADLQESYKQSRSAMSKAQQEKAEFTKQYQWARDLENDLRDPALRKEFEQAYQTWSSQRVEAQGYGQGRMPSFGSSEIQELKTKVASVTLNASLDALDRELRDELQITLTPEQRGAIWEEIARTDNEDVNAIYWGRFGKDIVKKASTAVAKQTAQ
jgi:hypothetical protein